MAPYDILLKLAVCGEPCVGKSRFAAILTDDVFENEYMKDVKHPYSPTVGLDMLSLITQTSSNRYAKVHILDTSGDDRYRQIISSYFSCVCTAIIITDSRRSNLITSTLEWIDCIRKKWHSQPSPNNIPIYVVNNGFDTDAKIKADQARGELRALCKREKIGYYDMCLDDRSSVWRVFSSIIKRIDKAYLASGTKVPGINYQRKVHFMPTSPLLGNDAYDEGDGVGVDGGRLIQKCCSIL